MVHPGFAEPTLLQVAVRKWSQRLERARDRRMAVADGRQQMAAAVPMLIRVMLTLAGFGCLTVGAFMLTIVAGFAVAGISCFVLSWLGTPAASTNDQRR